MQPGQEVADLQGRDVLGPDRGAEPGRQLLRIRDVGATRVGGEIPLGAQVQLERADGLLEAHSTTDAVRSP